MTPAGTSNELDVQNELEENTQKGHTYILMYIYTMHKVLHEQQASHNIIVATPVLYYTVLYYTILYYNLLYYTIIYYTIIYYTILYGSKY